MADLEWPEGLVPYKTAFYLQPHVGGQESPFTRTKKVYGLSAPRWVARMTFRLGADFDARDVGLYGPASYSPAYWTAHLDALIAQMKGGLNRVLLYDFRRPMPRFYMAQLYDATVDAVLAGSNTMTLDVTYGAMGFSVGDYVGGDGRPHIVTKVTSPTAPVPGTNPQRGKLSIEFEPPLSLPIVQGTPVVWHHVTAPFRLADPDNAGQNESEVGVPTDYVLDLLEDL